MVGSLSIQRVIKKGLFFDENCQRAVNATHTQSASHLVMEAYDEAVTWASPDALAGCSPEISETITSFRPEFRRDDYGVHARNFRDDDGVPSRILRDDYTDL